MSAGAGRKRASPRHGSAAVAIVIAMVVMQLAVVGLVLAGARDHELTVARTDTIRAFYAAEAGMNMALREVRMSVDADGDGVIGSVSDDADPVNDPTFSGARVSVSLRRSGTRTILTSTGRCGPARRRIEATLE